jgi:hypothetical protein
VISTHFPHYVLPRRALSKAGVIFDVRNPFGVGG